MLKSFPQLRDQTTIPLENNHQLETLSVESNQSIHNSEELYGLNRWGKPYFRINNLGHITVSPQGVGDKEVDLFKLVEVLESRDINLPLLIHFPDIIEDRIKKLNLCFTQAITKYEYEGSYQGVFPIKVNQQRPLIESIIRCGNQYHYGLEVGSKPELLIALAQLKDSNSLLLCNGYKDKVYIETALLASRLGYNIIIVAEQLSEIRLLIDIAKDHDINPVLGIRAKLSAKGDSRWANSSGDKGKFGLSVVEIIKAVNELKTAGMLHALQLVHFHIGSQISAIATIKEALSEASQIYVNLCQLGAPMQYFDVGGGLAMDYDGSHSNCPQSKNYSMQNYANDVVAAIQIACDSRKIQAPIIISESGRAIASHQSILVVNVLGVDTVEKFNHTIEVENCHQLVQEISEIYDEINESNCQESYHDILQVKKEVESLFSFGYISLYERGKAESLFWKCCDKIKTILQQINSDIDELEKLQQLLISTYYCNFSVFKSLPDSWSIEQLFPIMPIHRLDEQPNQRGILADITCDSDGKISQFIDHQTVKNYLELHQWDQDKPYYLGVFLSGAYQESLGSLHNLFGDTNTVYIHLNSQGDYLESVIKGDSIAQVLKSVKYDSKNMIKTMQKKTEKALEEKRITLEESLLFLNHYENALCHNTYLK